MKKIKVVIVDDEPLARERIRTLLAGEPDFELLAECKDGHEAIQAMEDLTPDLVFLDVQMPEINGFDVLLSLDRARLPAVIFITAYEQYAIQAFEVHALDYLLKPFDQDRFSEALDLARRRLGEQQPDDHRRQIAGLLADLRTAHKACGRLTVKSEGRILFLPMDEIDWIEAAGNYVYIHRGKERHLLRETMKGMERRLHPDRFVRIHRSIIVNIEGIAEMQPAFNGEYIVMLRNGAELKMSRNFRSALEDKIGKIL